MGLIPKPDEQFLERQPYGYTLEEQGSDIHLILKEVKFPEQYTPRTADVLIILPTGYPNAKLDMFRTRPDIKLANGSWPDRADVHVVLGGESWQQWSRHYEWRDGIDELRTFIASVHKEISLGV